MEDNLITTKEVGDYRIKVYYCRDSGMWRVARVTGLKSTRRYLCNRKTRIRYLFLEPERPDVI